MFVAWCGTVLGLFVGYAAAGGPGAAFGAVFGTVIGLLWSTARDAVRRAPAGAVLAREAQAILCETKGRVAEATFVRDAGSGAWLDVTSCSLCSPEDAPTCDKRCLLLIRNAMPARRHPIAGSEPRG